MSLPVLVDSVYLNSNVFYAQLSISLLDLIYFLPFLILLGKQVYLKSNNTFPSIVFEKLQISLWAIRSDIPKVGIVT